MLAVTRTGLKLGTDCHRSCRNISLQNLLAAVLPFTEKLPPPPGRLLEWQSTSALPPREDFPVGLCRLHQLPVGKQPVTAFTP